MPQLALETFVSQYFWLLVTFFMFYIFSTFWVIPKIAYMQKARLVDVSSEGANNETEMVCSGGADIELKEIENVKAPGEIKKSFVNKWLKNSLNK